jgi:hypothetical protein
MKLAKEKPSNYPAVKERKNRKLKQEPPNCTTFTKEKEKIKLKEEQNQCELELPYLPVMFWFEFLKEKNC